MWIKLTIIFGIIAICSYTFAKLMAEALEPDEKLAMALGYPPKKVVVPALIAALSAIVAVVCLIVTVVTW